MGFKHDTVSVLFHPATIVEANDTEAQWEALFDIAQSAEVCASGITIHGLSEAARKQYWTDLRATIAVLPEGLRRSIAEHYVDLASAACAAQKPDESILHIRTATLWAGYEVDLSRGPRKEVEMWVRVDGDDE